ncbi:MAG TPA: translation initiation factor IF-2 [Candidatus Bathyarchaeia archaeon]|nr:translation initiation factor IF-2 [Candidatus Bathyarchaeia archaeon]
MNEEKALEVLRYMLFEVDSAAAEISDEECDLLIEYDEDDSVAERVRDAKLKERKKKEEAAKKAEQKRKAEAKKRAAAKAKQEAAERKAAEAARLAAEAAGASGAVVAELEAPAAAVEAAGKPAAKKKYAEILPAQEKPKGPAIVIGSAIEHEVRTVEVLRADGTRLDIPEAETMGLDREAVVEEEEEESGLLAEAQRRQEEEEKRRAKAAARPLPEPDPAVVAEVIRKAAERNLKQPKKEQAKPAKLQKLEKQQRAERMLQAPEEEVRHRKTGSTGKTARKRMKRAEKERAEAILRRDAAIAVREYQSGGMAGGVPRRHKRKRVHEGEAAVTQDVETPEILEVEDRMTVEALAQAMDVPVNDIILDLMDHDVLATKNHTLGIEIIRQVAEARGFEVRTAIPEEELVLAAEPDNPEDVAARAPVITVMGHVDHGKTTLLDVVRSANVAEGEAGGITQHIAAYDVPIKTGRVVFLDTPGHEAFTQMRARGSKATDIVVLVVAADDGVMPQTIEAIDHARAAEVPIVVAINKCDKPDAQPDRIRQELTQYNLVDEQWGGKTIIKNISAKTKQGVDELMELLLLEAELLDLKANPTKRAQGVIVESEITRGMGPVAWVLVQNGTLRVGDFFLAGETHGRVRTLQNSRGEPVQEAGPATPVVVTGFSEPPEAGTTFNVVSDERVARAIAERRMELSKQRLGPAAKHITLEDFHAQMLAGEKSELRVVLKADVQGSVDVLSTSLAKLGNEEVRVDLVHGGVGGVNESDVLLASASDAVIIGFHVTANAKVKKLAEHEGVDIRTYRVIYEAIADVKAALEGMLAPESKETVTGHVEIRQVFRSSTFGNVAGCSVQDGEVARGAQVRLTRDDQIIYTGRIGTLRRGKEDVRSVTAGLECGIKLENYEDIKEGDVIEAYKVEQIAKALA